MKKGQCALVSYNRLSKTNKLNWYMKKSLDTFFLLIFLKVYWTNFGSRKLFLLKKNFLIKYVNALQVRKN